MTKFRNGTSVGVMVSPDATEADRKEAMVKVIKKDIMDNTGLKPIIVGRSDGKTVFLPTPQRTGSFKAQEDYAEMKARELYDWMQEAGFVVTKSSPIEEILKDDDGAFRKSIGAVDTYPGTDTPLDFNVGVLGGKSCGGCDSDADCKSCKSEGSTRIVNKDLGNVQLSAALGIATNPVELNKKLNDTIDYTRDIVSGKSTDSYVDLAAHLEDTYTPAELIYLATGLLEKAAAHMNLPGVVREDN